MRPLAMLALFALAAPAALAAEAPALVDTCFVPREWCTPRIVATIATAERSIRVQAFGFSSPPILAALAAAHRRGVDVRILLDKTAEERRYTGATFMASAGVPVWIDYRPAIAHTKAIIVDGTVVVGGSFNYTRAADARNVEDVTFTRSHEVAGRFLVNWEQRRAMSVPYQAGVTERPSPDRAAGTGRQADHHRHGRWPGPRGRLTARGYG